VYLLVVAHSPSIVGAPRRNRTVKSERFATLGIAQGRAQVNHGAKKADI